MLDDGMRYLNFAKDTVTPVNQMDLYAYYRNDNGYKIVLKKIEANAYYSGIGNAFYVGGILQVELWLVDETVGSSVQWPELRGNFNVPSAFSAAHNVLRLNQFVVSKTSANTTELSESVNLSVPAGMTLYVHTTILLVSSPSENYSVYTRIGYVLDNPFER